jgi:hypothetical protein
MRRIAWIGGVALIVLAGRAIGYALSPSPLAADFAHRAGGPALPIVAAVSLAIAVLVSAAIVWLAALGVRERRLLETRPSTFQPRLRPWMLAGRAAALTAGSLLGFALLESYVHWRAGLGWHGLHCLTGPVHANALPVLAALSLIAAAGSTALEHVLAWMRRVLAILARVLAVAPAPLLHLRPRVCRRASAPRAAFARGPPRGS